MPQVYVWQTAVRPYVQRLRAVPELVVFPAPADKALVHPPDAPVRVAVDRDTGPSKGVLHDCFRWVVGDRAASLQEQGCVGFGQVEAEAPQGDHLEPAAN